MAETCAIDFLYPTFYSTFIAIWGLRRLILPFLIRAGPDFNKFRAKLTKCGFHVNIYNMAKYVPIGRF